MARILVTISRQLGSGGAIIGQQVAERLGIRYLDREMSGGRYALMKKRSRLEEREERMMGFGKLFSGNSLLGTPEAGISLPPFNFCTMKIFSWQSRLLSGKSLPGKVR